MTIDSQTKQRLAKVLALAEQGVGGEREAANAILDELLQKYELTREELMEAAAINNYKFTYRNVLERRLLFQILSRVTDGRVNTYYRTGARALELELTAEEHEDVKQLYTVYKEAWAEEVEALFSAFVQKHKLYRQTVPEDEQSDPLSPEEIERLIRRMGALKDVVVPVLENRRLPEGEF